MKLLLLCTLLFLSLIACNSADETPKTEKINVKELIPGQVIHDSLSKEQLEKIAKIQKTFAAVYPASLEETITNFKRDQHPDREIAIWMQMASAYELFLSKYTALDSNQRNEAFELLLLRSMMPGEEAIQEAKLKGLNKAQINELMSYYNSEATRIRIEEK